MAANLEKIELFFSASGLPLKFHSLSNTYPFAVIYEIDRVTKQPRKVGRTDKVMDLHPVWTQSLVVEFLFQVQQLYVIKVFSADGSKDLNDESKHRLIGEAVFELSPLLATSGSRVTLPLVQKGENRDLGNVTIRAEAKADTRDLFCVTFSANNLSNKEGFFSKSDPFIVFLRCNEDSSYSKVWESSVVPNSLNPRWSQAKIPMSTLCNGDIHRPLRIEIYDHERNGKHVFMGQINEISVASLLESRNVRLNVIEPIKQAKSRTYVNSGILQADDCSIEKHYSFTQYIQGGLEIGLVVAIDFTGSNGDARLADSLHYIHPTGERLNEYETAIISVGKILETYDTDKMYPVYGFGARLKNETGQFEAVAQHCFPVYGGGVEVHGVDGILQAYRDAVKNVLFSGPTLFGPLLNTVAATVEGKGCTQESQKFTVLLILTDGVINDMEATMRTLIRASGLPLSVVIVGVGSADFNEMKRLDSDSGLLTFNRETAIRDIVQFVPFRAVAAQGTSVLAQELLAEIPTQIINFLEGKKIIPKNVSTSK
eukprot:gene7719-8337_t